MCWRLLARQQLVSTNKAGALGAANAISASAALTAAAGGSTAAQCNVSSGAAASASGTTAAQQHGRSAWAAAALAAAAAAAAASLAAPSPALAAEPDPALPPSHHADGVAAGHSKLLPLGLRRRIFFKYEKRIREMSTLEKVYGGYGGMRRPFAGGHSRACEQNPNAHHEQNPNAWQTAVSTTLGGQGGEGLGERWVCTWVLLY